MKKNTKHTFKSIAGIPDTSSGYTPETATLEEMNNRKKALGDIEERFENIVVNTPEEYVFNELKSFMMKELDLARTQTREDERRFFIQLLKAYSNMSSL